MPSDSHERIDALCLEVLSKDAADRAAFLDEACGGDDGLRREVNGGTIRLPAPSERH